MKRILIPFLLLMTIGFNTAAKQTPAAPLPNPFTDLPGYIEAVRIPLATDPVSVTVRHYGPNTLFITSVGGFADYQIPYMLGLSESHAGSFTSRSDTLSMTITGEGVADAVIYMHSGEVLRQEVSAGTYYFDVSIYPFPDAWISMDLEEQP
jgi:hypothetical protein